MGFLDDATQRTKDLVQIASLVRDPAEIINAIRSVDSAKISNFLRLVQRNETQISKMIGGIPPLGLTEPKITSISDNLTQNHDELVPIINSLLSDPIKLSTYVENNQSIVNDQLINVLNYPEKLKDSLDTLNKNIKMSSLVAPNGAAASNGAAGGTQQQQAQQQQLPEGASQASGQSGSQSTNPCNAPPPPPPPPPPPTPTETEKKEILSRMTAWIKQDIEDEGASSELVKSIAGLLSTNTTLIDEIEKKIEEIITKKNNPTIGGGTRRGRKVVKKRTRKRTKRRR